MAAMSVARKSHLDSLAISVLLACCMLWGFQQVLVKATIAEVAPVFQAALRFVLATAALWLWCGWRRIPLWAHDGTLWAGLLAGGAGGGVSGVLMVPSIQTGNVSKLWLRSRHLLQTGNPLAPLQGWPRQTTVRVTLDGPRKAAQGESQALRCKWSSR